MADDDAAGGTADRAAGVLAAAPDPAVQRLGYLRACLDAAIVSPESFDLPVMLGEWGKALAAVEAAMTLADRWDGQATDMRARALRGTRAPAWHPDHPERLAACATERETCARDLRAAIAAALTGEDRK